MKKFFQKLFDRIKRFFKKDEDFYYIYEMRMDIIQFT